jgi:hypothetical protein
VFFRAPSFDVAFQILGNLATPGPLTLASYPVMLVLATGLAAQYCPRRWRFRLELTLARTPALLRGAGLAVALFLIQLLGPTGAAPFIYFQF